MVSVRKPFKYSRTINPSVSGSGADCWAFILKAPLFMSVARLRADAASHSYAVEKSHSSGWQRVASFLVAAGTCKE